MMKYVLVMAIMLSSFSNANAESIDEKLSSQCMEHETVSSKGLYDAKKSCDCIGENISNNPKMTLEAKTWLTENCEDGHGGMAASTNKADVQNTINCTKLGSYFRNCAYEVITGKKLN